MKKLFQSFICQSVFLLSFLLLYSSCQFDIKNDTTLPSDIYNLKVQEEDSCIILNWENPTDSEFNKIEISITPSLQGVSQLLLNEKTNTYQWQNLTNNIEYTFTLYTIDKKNNKSKGVTIKGTPIDKTPPSEVSDISATTGDSFIFLSWTDPSDIDFSSVEICFTPSVNNVPQPILVQKKFGKQNSYKIFGLNNGIEYIFTLKTLDNNGNKSKGISFKASPEKPVEETPEEIKDNPPEEIKDNPPEEIKDETPPADVENFTANIGDSSILLSWTNPSDNDFSHIEITFIPKESNISQPIVKYGTKGSSDNKLIQGLQNETEYTFTIKTVDENGNKTGGKTVKAKPIEPVDKTPPAQVTNISVLPGDGSISLSWKNPNDEDFSYVEISVSSEQCNINETVIKQGNPGKTNSHFFNGLENGTEYLFCITTVDINGNKSEPIIINERPEDLIPPSDVSNFTASVEYNNIILSWTNPSDADFKWLELWYSINDESYRLELMNGNPSEYCTYPIRFARSGDYSFKIIAIDDSGNNSSGVTTHATQAESMISLNIILPNDTDENIILSKEVAPIKLEIESTERITKVAWKKGEKGVIPDADRLLFDSTAHQLSLETINTFNVTENGVYDIAAKNEAGITDIKQIEIKTIDRQPLQEVQNLYIVNDGSIVNLSWINPEQENDYDSPLKEIVVSYVYNDDNQDSNNGSVILNADKQSCSIEISDGKSEADFITFTICTVDKLENTSSGLSSRTYCCDCITTTWSIVEEKLASLNKNTRVIVFGDCENNDTGPIKRGLDALKNNNSQVMVNLDLSQTNGMTCIETSGFSGCINLMSVILPDSVTKIKGAAFINCSNLAEIIMRGVREIGGSAFYNCNSLESMVTPYGQKNVLPGSIGDSAFYNCTSLSEIDITHWDAKGNHVFSFCSNLITVNGVNQSLVAKGFNTDFYNCNKIENVFLAGPEYFFGKKIPANAFFQTTFNTIIIPDGFIEIEYRAFADSNITKVIIPESVSKIGHDAFGNCENLIEATITENVMKAGVNNIFSNCQNLTEITVSGEPTTIPQNAFESCCTLKHVLIPESVTSIGYSAFKGCSCLESFSIPNNVTTIEAQAFDGCNNLKDVYIPNSVSTIGSAAFQNCTAITSISIPNGVTLMKSAIFRGCINLKNVNIPNGITSIGSSAFEGCIALTEIEIPNNVNGIGSSTFKGCVGLTDITIPDGITSIGSSAFEGCIGLTEIEIPNNVNKISSSTFKGCVGLTDITIPNGITSIGSSAFEGCIGLTEIEIPNNVNEIGSSAFKGCTGLTNITIPSGVTSIAMSVFEDCISLEGVTIPASVSIIYQYAFLGCKNGFNIQFEDLNSIWDSYREKDVLYATAITFSSDGVNNARRIIDTYKDYYCLKKEL